MSPLEEAKYWAQKEEDKPGFQKKFIDDFIGRKIIDCFHYDSRVIYINLYSPMHW